MATDKQVKAMKYKVPVLNLQEQYSLLGTELENAVLSVLRSGEYILGGKGLELERQIAKVCGCDHGIGVANGTDALELALWALDIGAGDEVITPSFTFAATGEAVLMRGAKPVFVEVDEKTFNIDTNKIEALITKNTKAIMPVHLYGMPSNMDSIMALAKEYSLKVIEDNAQAIGASYKDKPTGAFGDLACISFYPTKNLGACGDAGMIVTNNADLAERLRKLRAHGMKKRYHHEELGINSRLDEIQAAILLTKLPYLNKWNARRAEIAQTYNEALKNINWLGLPSIPQDSSITHVWHQYTVTVNIASSNNDDGGTTRDAVIAKLSEHGIGSMCYYPIPLHLQQPYSPFGYRKGDFPITEKLAQRVISLPMYPELTDEEIQTVASTLNKISQELMPVASQAHVYTGV